MCQGDVATGRSPHAQALGGVARCTGTLRTRKGAGGKREGEKRIHAGAQRVAAMWRPQAAKLRFSAVVLEATERQDERTMQDAREMFAAVAAH